MVYFILEKISKNYPNSSVMILSRYKRERDKIKKKLNKINAKEILHSENLSKVSIVGVGIANRPGVAADMFEALSENNINMHMVTTSEIKISILVNSSESELAVKAIHDKFFK